jgi:predicted RNase H-related nuclease YkuK (DUF458 family)
MEKLIESNWRRLTDSQEIELVSYIKEWMEVNPGHRIYIGCDSQNKGRSTTYATVVVLHYHTGGGHVLYRRDKIEKITSSFERLWKEVELSVDVANLLINSGLGKPDCIDVDLNPDPRYNSNQLLRAAVGLIESMGIQARYKSKSPWAISIADTMCKSKSGRKPKKKETK